MTLRSLSRFYELIVTQSLKSSKKILRDQLFDCFLFTQRYFGITTTLICLFYFFSVTSLMRDKSFYLRLIDNRMLRHTKVLKLKLFWCFFGKKNFLPLESPKTAPTTRTSEEWMKLQFRKLWKHCHSSACFSFVQSTSSTPTQRALGCRIRGGEFPERPRKRRNKILRDHLYAWLSKNRCFATHCDSCWTFYPNRWKLYSCTTTYF